MELGADNESLRGPVCQHLDPHRATDAVETPHQRDDEPAGRSDLRVDLRVDQTISSWNCSPSRAEMTLRSVRRAFATLPFRPITLPMSSSATRSSMTVAPASWLTVTSTCSGWSTSDLATYSTS